MKSEIGVNDIESSDDLNKMLKGFSVEMEIGELNNSSIKKTLRKVLKTGQVSFVFILHPKML